MNNYQLNLKGHKTMGGAIQDEAINMRRLEFKEPDLACDALEEGLQIHWEEEEKGEMEYSKQSDCPENPV
jgi:hypothetical protein